MTDVAVVTANYGGFDPVHPQAQQDIAVDWVYITDDPNLSGSPWGMRVVESDLPPRLAGKFPKFCPLEGYRYTICINANYEITSSACICEALEYLHDGIALYRHPYRDCIYDEREASRLPKYDGQPMDEQVAFYRSEGHPEHWGLWESGFIVWDWEHPKVKLLAEAWLAECQRWTLQDQLPFPYLCRKLKIEPGTFPHGLIGSPWVAFPHGHLR